VDTAGFSRAEAQARPTMRDSELRNLLALANDFKEGDLLVGGTLDDAVREDARLLLLSTRLGDIADTVIVEDGVTEALIRSADRAQRAELARLTVSDLKQILVAADCAAWVERHRDGLASEVIAAVVKVMNNDELAVVAGQLFNPLPGQGVTIGSPGHFGSRIQPNSPGDDEQEILFQFSKAWLTAAETSSSDSIPQAMTLIRSPGLKPYCATSLSGWSCRPATACFPT
jgi:ethanolamine ammonia-lyase large subunit